MPVQTDIYNAFVSNPAGPDPVALRDALRKRTPYVLAPNESSQDLVATDPITGAVIQHLAQNGRVYALDIADHSSQHDGVSVLVTFDGLVYKLDSLSVPYAVLSKNLTSPPLFPLLGDSYLIVGAGSGAWAGKGPLVTLTGWGWESVQAPPGRLIYVEDIDAYYRVDSYGNVLSGFGNAALSPGSVRVSHLLSGGNELFFTVKNQTTNTPPVLTGSGDAYIVGPVPTGVWAGKATWIAIDEGAQWGMYQPNEGWRAYDQNVNTDLRFNGTSWNTSSGFGATAVFRLFGAGSTTIAGQISSVVQGTGVITWTVNHGLTTGQIIKTNTTWPNPLAGNAVWVYIRVLSVTTFTLHLTLADANAGTNPITFTGNQTNPATAVLVSNLQLLASSNVQQAVLAFVAANSTDFTIEITFTTLFANANYVALPLASSIGTGTPAVVSAGAPKIKTTSKITYSFPGGANYNTLTSGQALDFQTAILSL